MAERSPSTWDGWWLVNVKWFVFELLSLSTKYISELKFCHIWETQRICLFREEWKMQHSYLYDKSHCFYGKSHIYILCIYAEGIWHSGISAVVLRRFRTIKQPQKSQIPYLRGSASRGHEIIYPQENEYVLGSFFFREKSYFVALIEL